MIYAVYAKRLYSLTHTLTQSVLILLTIFYMLLIHSFAIKLEQTQYRIGAHQKYGYNDDDDANSLLYCIGVFIRIIMYVICICM